MAQAYPGLFLEEVGGYAPAMYDALICDIDGCLSPESHDPFDLASIARIAEFNRRAHELGEGLPRITLCSGRPVTAVEMVCRMIGNTSLPCVAEMGVWLYDPSRGTYEMDPAILPEHKAAVGEAQRWAELELVPAGSMIQPGKHASVSLHHPDVDHLHAELTPRVEAITRREGWPLRVSSTWAWINWDLEHISKSTGIDRVLERTGLVRERLGGIGDTMSDLAIREHVAFFACPANAKEGLKARADYVASADEAVGVVEILRKLG